MSYNASNGTASNKPYSVAQGVPDGGRTWFYDTSAFLWRPFKNAQEVLDTLDTATKRSGANIIVVNEGGTFNAGLSGYSAFTGGVYKEYWFKGVADNDLTVKVETKTFTDYSVVSDVNLGTHTGTDNITAVNRAIAENREVQLNKDLIVSAKLTNTKGTKISGEGRIFLPIANDLQLLNLSTDKNQHIFGKEYLSALHKRLIAGNSIIARNSGDSTTAGDATTSPFHLDAILTDLCAKYGISNITWQNAGHSGENSGQWLSTHLANDMAANPHLYLLRWGINDAGYSGDLDVAADQVISNYRTGLQKIRLSANSGYNRSSSVLTIVLQTPNTTRGDTYGHKSEAYNEKISKGLRVLAREYQCVFIDTYALWADCRNNTDFMEIVDTGGGNLASVHPLDVMNTWIASNLFDVIFPSYYRNGGGSSISNPTPSLPNGTAVWTKQPEDYPTGLSIDFVGSDGVTAGFPFAGTLFTIKQTVGTVLQFLSNFNTNDDIETKVVSRTGWFGNPTGNKWMPFTTNNTGLNNNTATLPSGNILYTKLPQEFPFGISIDFCGTAGVSSGFPFPSEVTTIRHKTGTVIQFLNNYDYSNSADASTAQLYMRTGFADAWTPLRNLTPNDIDANKAGNSRLSTDAISTYNIGISQCIVQATNGFPINGQLITFRSSTAGVTHQFLSSYQGSSVVYFRNGWTTDGWGSFILLNKVVAASADTTASVTTADATDPSTTMSLVNELKATINTLTAELHDYKTKARAIGLLA